MTPIVTLFNHKGGVGKTTITVNLARGLSQIGISTMVADCDPQCNASAFYLPEEDLDKFMEEAQEVDKGQTIWSSISKSVRGRGEVRAIKLEKVEDEGAGVWLAVGDIALAAFEDRLAEAWRSSFSRDPTSIDLVSALRRSLLLSAKEHAIRLILVDVGPSIASLNRVLLLSSDFFVVPVGCDLFSLRALATLGTTISSWMDDWATIADLAKSLADVSLLPGKPEFAGYLAQHFNIYRARATAPFEEWERRIAPRIKSQIVDRLPTRNAALVGRSNKIGEIQAFHSLAPLSQKHGVPIGGLYGLEGVNSGYAAKIGEADSQFRGLAKEISQRVGL